MQYSDYLKMRNFTVTTEDGEYQPQRYSLLSKSGILRLLRNASNTTNSGEGLIKLTVINYLAHYGMLTTASAVTGLPLIIIPATPIMLGGVNPIGIFKTLYSRYGNKIGEIKYKLQNKFKDKNIKYVESSKQFASGIKIEDKNNYIVNVDGSNTYVYGRPEGYDRDIDLFTEINRLVNNGITEFKVLTGKQVKKLIPKQYLME